MVLQEHNPANQNNHQIIIVLIISIFCLPVGCIGVNPAGTLVIYLSVQGIVPQSASNAVKELFVPENEVQVAKAEAEKLPALEITKVCNHSYRCY